MTINGVLKTRNWFACCKSCVPGIAYLSFQIEGRSLGRVEQLCMNGGIIDDVKGPCPDAWFRALQSPALALRCVKPMASMIISCVRNHNCKRGGHLCCTLGNAHQGMHSRPGRTIPAISLKRHKYKITQSGSLMT